MSKVLGLDYGSVRIGAAISDEERVFAFEMEIFPREGFAQRYASLVTEHDVGQTVLGYPVSLGGKHTATTDSALSFRDELAAAVPGVPIEMVDERFSSQFAHGHAGAGKKSDKGKRGIDSLAAQVILQNYLERSKNIKK